MRYTINAAILPQVRDPAFKGYPRLHNTQRIVSTYVDNNKKNTITVLQNRLFLKIIIQKVSPDIQESIHQ